MRRTALTLAILLTVAACGGTTSETTVAAETTTTLAEEPTTSEADPVEGTATTSGTPTSFDIVEGTPAAAFDSFQSTLTMTMDFAGVEIEVTSSGVWVDGSFDCLVSTGTSGFGFEQGLIATPETLWFDAGNGYEESALFNSGAQEVMATCPTSPLFWADFTASDTAGLKGDKTTIEGREVYRADLTEFLGLAAGLGVAGDLEGATINEMAMWIDVETGTPLRVLADMELAEEFMGTIDESVEATGDLKLVMEVTVERINDPTLAVRTP